MKTFLFTILIYSEERGRKQSKFILSYYSLGRWVYHDRMWWEVAQYYRNPMLQLNWQLPNVGRAFFIYILLFCFDFVCLCVYFHINLKME